MPLSIAKQRRAVLGESESEAPSCLEDVSQSTSERFATGYLRSFRWDVHCVQRERVGRWNSLFLVLIWFACSDVT